MTIFRLRIWPDYSNIETLEVCNNHCVSRTSSIVFLGPILAITNLAGCFNFDRTSFNDKVSSIDTRGNCYFLYEDANCQGRWVRIAPYSEGDRDLADVAFNDVASSIRACDDNYNNIYK